MKLLDKMSCIVGPEEKCELNAARTMKNPVIEVSHAFSLVSLDGLS